MQRATVLPCICTIVQEVACFTSMCVSVCVGRSQALLAIPGREARAAMLPSAFEAADASGAADPEQELLSTSPLRLLQVSPACQCVLHPCLK